MNSELNSKASGHAALDELFQTKGYTDYKWINPKEIIVSQWARIKCMFGCGKYGNNSSCPPNVPSVDECEKFFHEYSDAVIFRYQKKVDKPGDRHKWSRKVNSDLLKLERAVFFSNYPKAVLFLWTAAPSVLNAPGKEEPAKNQDYLALLPKRLPWMCFQPSGALVFPLKFSATIPKL
ncbi:MAG: DUF2284 domain-containing protein [Desulfobacterales bacterium]|nr:DUF2284 domain-containing protein [Desulfobacterales bacterium]